MLGRLAYARLCADVARMTHQSTWTFFLTHQFAWGTARIGTVLAAGALAGALFQAGAVGPVVRRLGDKRAAVVGGLLGVVALAGTAFITVPWSLHLLQAVGVLAATGAAPGLVFVGAAVFAAGSTLLLATTPDLRQP